MKIVTYNVNGLRPRISQFGSLRKLLDSFDADIICFQETKLRRQELTADLVMADGYESFFSCTRTTDKGRTAYSGVATFCRVNSAFSSDEIALPVEAEEGFTGLHAKSQFKKEEKLHVKEGLEDFAIDELSKVDNEGRCIVTDHGHFVLFNIYGPRAVCDDAERIQFKHFFFQVLQKRWENLLHQRRIVIAVGDFNIAPKAIDRCDAEPDFENNEFRKWFRSMLVENGGPFYDVFRSKYPDRKDAFTCWPQNSGAEVFNFGSRIDHIISAGECLHQKYDLQGHNFVTCHVNGCDILTQYSRWKPQNEPSHRWKGGRNTKLEGSDHAPVCMSLVEIPNVSAHNTPSLSSRYLPAVRGLQQTIVSVLMKRQVAAEQVNSPEASSSMSNEDMTLGRCSDNSASASDLPRTQHCDGVSARTDECSSVFPDVTIKSEHLKSLTSSKARKKAKKCQLSQLSLKSFFQKGSSTNNSAENAKTDAVLNEAEDLNSVHQLGELSHKDESRSPKQTEPCTSPLSGHEEKLSTCSTGQNKNNAALMEWQRIQEVMQNSIPLCKGHSEQCVARVVKKPGPNYGRRFYVCARAEGPSANPDANCGFFRWAAYKAGRK